MGATANDHIPWKPGLHEDICCLEQLLPFKEETMLTSIPLEDARAGGLLWQCMQDDEQKVNLS